MVQSLPLLPAYDFAEFATIVDVGGATGNLLSTILGRYSKPRGILFDLPHVVADAPKLISARGLMNRIKIESGSFFENVPSGGDVYLLSHIIHDWSETQCLTILIAKSNVPPIVNFIDGIFIVERSAMTAGLSVRNRRSKNSMQSGRQHSGGMQ
jgi:hypothetical protein